jgi:hypothetical protein
MSAPANPVLVRVAREAAPISVDAAGEDEVIAGIRTGLEPATSGADSIEPRALRGINEKRVNPKLTLDAPVSAFDRSTW